MTDIDYLEMLRSSFTLIILIFCSILALTFAIERWIFFRRIRLDASACPQKLRPLLEQEKFAEAIALCEKSASPVAALAKTAIQNHKKPSEKMEELLEATQLEEKLKMERFLVVLGTLGNTAPFIGLFGTVIGIIKAFRDLALAGTGGPTVVAKGIAEALVATAAGLAVAIPAVIVYNYYMRKMKEISTQMDAASLRLLESLGS